MRIATQYKLGSFLMLLISIAVVLLGGIQTGLQFLVISFVMDLHSDLIKIGEKVNV